MDQSIRSKHEIQNKNHQVYTVLILEIQFQDPITNSPEKMQSNIPFPICLSVPELSQKDLNTLENFKIVPHLCRSQGR